MSLSSPLIIILPPYSFPQHLSQKLLPSRNSSPHPSSPCLAIIRKSIQPTFLKIQETDKNHRDLVMCRKQPGIAIGRLCDKCDGKCPVCDSYVRPTTLVRICDECSFGNYQNKCVVCGGEVSSQLSAHINMRRDVLIHGVL